MMGINSLIIILNIIILIRKKEEYIKAIKEDDEICIEKLKDENKRLKELLNNKKKHEDEINKKKKELINIQKLEQENIGNEIAIIFISADQIVHYPMICKKNEIFSIYEQKLYAIYPTYKETENFFICNGAKINRNHTIEKNKIKYGDIIQIDIIE